MVFKRIAYAAWNGRMNVNDELDRMQKEAVVRYCKILSQDLSARSGEKDKEKSAWMAGLRVECRNRNLPNKDREWSLLDRIIQCS
jgi:hypothetical protein